MAVALSLLIVLPGLASSHSYDDTRGTLSGGKGLTVAVLSGDPNDTSTDAVDESVSGSYFNGSLYVSNYAGKDNPETDAVERTGAALNQVRITAVGGDLTELEGRDGSVKDIPDTRNDVAAVNDTPAVLDDESADNINCVVATVKNNRSGKRIKVSLNATDDGNTATDVESEGDAGTVVFEVIANGLEEADNGTRVCGEEPGDTTLITPTELAPNDSTDGDPPTQSPMTLRDGSGQNGTAGPAIPGRMPAKHGDTLTITVDGIAGSVTLTVDAEGPEFSEISPADGAFLSSQTVKFRFVVSDSDSGIAHDGELDYSRGDNDARAFNSDDDNFTTTEPRALDSTGASRDIKVMMAGSRPSGDQSLSGSSGWRLRGGAPGVSYFLDMAVTNVGEGDNPWYLQATDRAGNTARTDAKPSKDGDQDFTLTVDVSSPEFKEARTGISYDPAKKEEIVDRSFIAVTFNDADSNFDAVKDVDASKFLVEDADVVGFIHLSDDDDCDDDNPTPNDIDGTCITDDQAPQSRIYLQLAEPLAPDATPQVSMFGGAVLDLAGNPSNQDEIIAADNISPAITVTMTTDITGRPVIKNNGEVTVSITSDEELRRLPSVYFAEIVEHSSSKEDKPVQGLANVRRGDRVTSAADAENAWTRTYNNGDIGSRDALYAVIVVAEDDADNVGSTPGWTRDRKTKEPEATHKAKFADLEAAGLLVEIDTETDFATDDFSLAPEAGPETDETESSNPFVTIDFGAEKGEYSKYDDIKGGDSHSAVEIVSITLNGNDVSDNVAEVEDNKYTLAARDLATGEYELKVTGRDDVGNEVKGTYEFDVVVRKAYKLSLIPGWNLVSVPGTPLDSSIGSVMGDSMQASIVLAYQDDAWLTAVNDNGTWRGTLTDIVGGYGYWVQTTAFESITALIPETDTSSVLPTARVIKGWNLLGVVDVLQAKAGDPPSGGDEADDYFDNISWKVAYSFDTSSNSWAKAIPEDGANDDEVVNGNGYWVWSTEAGVLVP